MNAKLSELINSKDPSALKSWLLKVQKPELSTILDKSILSTDYCGPQVLNALFKGLPNGSSKADPFESKRLFLFEYAINLMKDNPEDITDKQCSELSDVLILQSEFLPSDSIVDLCHLFIKFVKDEVDLDGKWFNIFPKLLATASLISQVTDLSKYPIVEISGQQFKSNLIDQLCSLNWNVASVIHLVTIFKDISLSNEELEKIISKVFSIIDQLEYPEVPPLAYQLLLLSLQGHRKRVLEGLMHFFNKEEEKLKNSETDVERELEIIHGKNSTDDLHHIEGTVIIHVTFAAKQDQEINKEVIKMLKIYQHAPARILSPFFFALSLSMTRLSRISDQVMELLKNAVLRSFKEKKLCKDSRFISENILNNFDVERVALEVVENSKFGWDYVIQGLVQFGFLLMDSFGPKAAFGRISEASVQLHDSPMSGACGLGANILSSSFLAHESVRSEILEQLLNRIVTHASSPITQYVDLLAQTIHSSPQLFLDSISKVREVLDYISFLPSVSSRQLLVSLIPLLKISMPLKDSLMLILRKALFSRHLEARKVAVTGFLLFLKHFKILGSLPNVNSQASQSSSCSISFLTQVTADIHVKFNYDSQTNEVFCLELMGTLRRCLQQQSEVRQILYTGFYEVIRRNEMLSAGIITLLNQQLSTYFESDPNINPPLNLNKCIGGKQNASELKEPLGHLIAILQSCLTTFDGKKDEAEEISADDLDSFEKASKVINYICKRVITSELEDFELDKSSDYNSSSNEGLKNIKKAQLLLGIYDALMEFSFTNGKFSVDSCQTVIDLFDLRSKLMKVINENSISSSKKKDANQSVGTKRQGSNKLITNLNTYSLFSINFVAFVLRALFNDTFPSHQESLKILRSNKEFIAYVLKSCNIKVRQLKDLRLSDSSAKIFQNLCCIGRALYKYYRSEQETCDEDDADLKDAKLASLALDVFCNTFETINFKFQDKLLHFLASIEKRVDHETTILHDDSEEDHMMLSVRKFQTIINSVVANESTESLKDINHLVGIIELLKSHVTEKSAEEIFKWIGEFCKQNELGDGTVVKSLLNLLLNMCRKTKQTSSVVRNMLCDIHSKMKDIMEDVEIDSCNYYKIIDTRFIIQSMSVIMQHTERLLEDVDWMITHMKSELGVSIHSHGDECRSNREVSICIQLGTLVTGLHALVQTALPRGPLFDLVFKGLIHFYNCMSNFVKYYIAKQNSGDKVISSKFEKLVKLSGMNLTPMVYSMINYVQSTHDTDARVDKKKKSSDSTSDKAKVLKECKGIPALIFSIEQNERFLIQLSKKSKINLMANVKLSTARDFRIDKNTISNTFEPAEESEHETSVINSTGTTITTSQTETDHQSQISIADSSLEVDESSAKKRKLKVMEASTIEKTDLDNSLPSSTNVKKSQKMRQNKSLSTSTKADESCANKRKLKPMEASTIEKTDLDNSLPSSIDVKKSQKMRQNKSLSTSTKALSDRSNKNMEETASKEAKFNEKKFDRVMAPPQSKIRRRTLGIRR